MTGLPPVEPSSEQRQGAIMLRGWFLALVASGFTEDQALRLISIQLASGSGS